MTPWRTCSMSDSLRNLIRCVRLCVWPNLVVRVDAAKLIVHGLVLLYGVYCHRRAVALFQRHCDPPAAGMQARSATGAMIAGLTGTHSCNGWIIARHICAHKSLAQVLNTAATEAHCGRADTAVVLSPCMACSKRRTSEGKVGRRWLLHACCPG